MRARCFGLKKLWMGIVLTLLLAGCSGGDALLPWRLEQGRWLAEYAGEGYTLEADIPSVSESIDRINRARAEGMARVFMLEVEQRLSELPEESGSGVWVLRGENTAIKGFTDSIALIEYAYLPRNAHGSYQIETTTYWAGSGTELELRSLFDAKVDVYRQLSRLSRWMLIRTGQLGDYADAQWIEAGTEPVADNFSAYLVRPEGLEIIFAPYQVGPWALGEQRITIPWLYLAEYLTPKVAKQVGVAGKNSDFAGEG